MGREEKKIMRRRLIRAYISSIVSISLVLLLVGVASLLIISARSVADYFKESMQMSVMLRQDVTEESALSFESGLKTLPYVKSTHLVTREEGTNDLKSMLGDDFLNAFETSPVPLSVDVSLKAEYVSPDSVAVVNRMLSANPMVEEVVYQQSLVEALNANLAKISLVLGVFIILMLFVSCVLISNTVRINIFSHRFNIHTMKLVGATKSFIRAPYLGWSVYQGLVSAVIALAMIATGLWLAGRSFPELLTLLNPVLLSSCAAVVVFAGILICLVSTWFVVGRLVSLDKEELYG